MKLTEADEQYFENLVYLKAVRDERGILGLIPDYERQHLTQRINELKEKSDTLIVENAALNSVNGYLNELINGLEIIINDIKCRMEE